MKTYKIYKLIDPRNQKAMFVGCTEILLTDRLKSHRNDLTHPEIYGWFTELIAQKLHPIIELIEETWCLADTDKWIEHYSKQNQLFNKRIRQPFILHNPIPLKYIGLSKLDLKLQREHFLNASK